MTTSSPSGEDGPIRCRRPIAFVVGASGYTGRALVAALRREGLGTVAHLRPQSGHGDDLATEFRSLGAQVDRTPWLEDAMSKTLARVQPTTVYALLGTTRARIKIDGQGYDEVDYGLTSRLFAACNMLRPIQPRFVYLSAIGADKPRGNPYLRARHRMEAELRSGTSPFIIVRPAFISGDDRAPARPLERWAARAIDRGLAGLARLGVHGPAEAYTSLDAETLADAMASLCYEPEHLGRVLGVAELRGLAQARRGRLAPTGGG